MGEWYSSRKGGVLFPSEEHSGCPAHLERGSTRHCILEFSHSQEVVHKACRLACWNPELPSVQFHLLFSPELEPPSEDNNNWQQPVCDCQFKDTGWKTMLSKSKREATRKRNRSTSHHGRARKASSEVQVFILGWWCSILCQGARECSRRMKPQVSAEQAAACHRQSYDVYLRDVFWQCLSSLLSFFLSLSLPPSSLSACLSLSL